ncbi:sialate O-acetylesterase [Bacteroidota bacterium]
MISKKINFLKFLLLPLFLVFFFNNSNGQKKLKLPAIIGDNMVLQQNSNVPLWGWAFPGSKIVMLTGWDQHEHETIVDDYGKWIIYFKTPSAGGPYNINITGDETISLKNVLIGEVWLCSGQSNMEMPLRGWMEYGQPIKGSNKAIAKANYQKIRLFTVERNTSFEPLDNCTGKWEECIPEVAKEFSAVGYFFGLELYKKMNIPVGLIHSSWGGTPAEAWTRNSDLITINKFQTDGEKIDPEKYQKKLLAAHQEKIAKWRESVGIDYNTGFSSANSGTTEWKKFNVPGLWQGTIFDGLQGVVMFKKTINIPSAWMNKNLVLELGPIDEMDITWFNSEKIGEYLNVSDWTKERKYIIPGRLVNQEENNLFIKIINTSGAGGIYGKAEQLIIYPENDTTNLISLSGIWEAQLDKKLSDIEPAPYCDNCSDAQLPTVLYNAMINPLIPYKIKGAIWYQGESNRNDAFTYRTLFPAMIKSWRNTWKQGDFPFYYVQIAPYTYLGGENSAELREAQLMALCVNKTGMAVTMDIGDLKCIHPPDKESVGKRLSKWALSKDYGFNTIKFSGPLYKSMKIEGNSIRVFFDYADNGLKSKGWKLTHFTIAGKNGKFYKAKAKIEGNSILVKSKKVKDPVAARYAWSNTAQPNLFNKSGLPASSFRTDNWQK